MDLIARHGARPCLGAQSMTFSIAAMNGDRPDRQVSNVSGLAVVRRSVVASDVDDRARKFWLNYFLSCLYRRATVESDYDIT